MLGIVMEPEDENMVAIVNMESEYLIGYNMP